MRLGGQVIEFIHSLGVVLDVFYNMENDEFIKRSKELCRYMPDSSSEISSIIGTRIRDSAGNDVAGIIASTNNANQSNLQINENYIEGFVRRRTLYNYKVAANDDYCDIELLIR